jgi:hypothetical protein
MARLPGDNEWHTPTFSRNRDSSGWILVWDMDETLVKGYPNPELNTKAIEVLKKAVEKRGTTVDKIFMLTNNSDRKYITLVNLMIYESIYPRKAGEEIPFGVFDDVMTRTHKSRPKKYDPPKRLLDVLTLMKLRDPEQIRNRVLFFDNLANHHIAGEIPREHYIHIKSDFTPLNTKGKTDWARVSRLLDFLPLRIKIPLSRTRSRSRSRSRTHTPKGLTRRARKS